MEALRRHVMAAGKLHADDTPVPVLAPGLGCVAIATDGHNTLAMLKRREGETLAQLLTRLDLAIGKAFTEDVFTDEINTPLRNSHRR